MRRGWLLATLLLAGCGEREAALDRAPGSVLEPHGEGAEVISREIWIQFAVSAAGLALVVGLLVWIVVRGVRRSPPAEDPREDGRGRRWLLLGGIVLPAVVLTFLFGLSIRDLNALGSPGGRSVATIEVVGHRWWWKVHYTGHPVTTANELVVPVGAPVQLRLQSRDVIHSFWVPQLQHKLDLIPNEWTSTWVRVEKPGVYRGVCAEFCGLEHARMHFLVRALPQRAWEEWLAAAAKPAKPPVSESARRGQQVFLSSSCAYCHTIRGTEAGGWLGPDLTHLASRGAIAGATLPNTRGNLAGWISDPQHQKPGALMPRTPLEGGQLQVLLDYLESLK
jgi:cytochrome c oxidase subunit II